MIRSLLILLSFIIATNCSSRAQDVGGPTADIALPSAAELNLWLSGSDFSRVDSPPIDFILGPSGLPATANHVFFRNARLLENSSNWYVVFPEIKKRGHDRREYFYREVAKNALANPQQISDTQKFFFLLYVDDIAADEDENAKSYLEPKNFRAVMRAESMEKLSDSEHWPLSCYALQFFETEEVPNNFRFYESKACSDKERDWARQINRAPGDINTGSFWQTYNYKNLPIPVLVIQHKDKLERLAELSVAQAQETPKTIVYKKMIGENEFNNCEQDLDRWSARQEYPADLYIDIRANFLASSPEIVASACGEASAALDGLQSNQYDPTHANQLLLIRRAEETNPITIDRRGRSYDPDQYTISGDSLKGDGSKAILVLVRKQQATTAGLAVRVEKPVSPDPSTLSDAEIRTVPPEDPPHVPEAGVVEAGPGGQYYGYFKLVNGELRIEEVRIQQSEGGDEKILDRIDWSDASDAKAGFLFSGNKASEYTVLLPGGGIGVSVTFVPASGESKICDTVPGEFYSGRPDVSKIPVICRDKPRPSRMLEIPEEFAEFQDKLSIVLEATNERIESRLGRCDGMADEQIAEGAIPLCLIGLPREGKVIVSYPHEDLPYTIAERPIAWTSNETDEHSPLPRWLAWVTPKPVVVRLRSKDLLPEDVDVKVSYGQVGDVTRAADLSGLVFRVTFDENPFERWREVESKFGVEVFLLNDKLLFEGEDDREKPIFEDKVYSVLRNKLRVLDFGLPPVVRSRIPLDLLPYQSLRMPDGKEENLFCKPGISVGDGPVNWTRSDGEIRWARSDGKIIKHTKWKLESPLELAPETRVNIHAQPVEIGELPMNRQRDFDADRLRRICGPARRVNSMTAQQLNDTKGALRLPLAKPVFMYFLRSTATDQALGGKFGNTHEQIYATWLKGFRTLPQKRLVIFHALKQGNGFTDVYEKVTATLPLDPNDKLSINDILDHAHQGRSNAPSLRTVIESADALRISLGYDRMWPDIVILGHELGDRTCETTLRNFARYKKILESGAQIFLLDNDESANNRTVDNKSCSWPPDRTTDKSVPGFDLTYVRSDAKEVFDKFNGEILNYTEEWRSVIEQLSDAPSAP